MNTTFNPQTLADDLTEVKRIYSRFFAALDESTWDKPVKGSSNEWTLHETIAHLCALHGAGLESVKHALRGEPYTFAGLDNRYQLTAYNRKGIDDHLDMPMSALCAEFSEIHRQAARIARDLRPDQTSWLTSPMPYYNRPLSVVEALSIIMVHAGLFHAAQVAEPAGQPPLWQQLSAEIRHRAIGRTLRAFSLLYRVDLSGSLRTTLVFRVDGPGGGEWHLALSPEAPMSAEGAVDHPGLLIHMRDTAVFCHMLTARLNLPLALISGSFKLRGDLRLFRRMDTLFSVDARPRTAAKPRVASAPQHLAGTRSK